MAPTDASAIVETLMEVDGEFIVISEIGLFPKCRISSLGLNRQVDSDGSDFLNSFITLAYIGRLDIPTSALEALKLTPSICIDQSINISPTLCPDALRWILGCVIESLPINPLCAQLRSQLLPRLLVP